MQGVLDPKALNKGGRVVLPHQFCDEYGNLVAHKIITTGSRLPLTNWARGPDSDDNLGDRHFNRY